MRGGTRHGPVRLIVDIPAFSTSGGPAGVSAHRGPSDGQVGQRRAQVGLVARRVDDASRSSSSDTVIRPSDSACVQPPGRTLAVGVGDPEARRVRRLAVTPRG